MHPSSVCHGTYAVCLYLLLYTDEDSAVDPEARQLYRCGPMALRQIGGLMLPAFDAQ